MVRFHNIFLDISAVTVACLIIYLVRWWVNTIILKSIKFQQLMKFLRLWTLISKSSICEFLQIITYPVLSFSYKGATVLQPWLLIFNWVLLVTYRLPVSVRHIFTRTISRSLCQKLILCREVWWFGSDQEATYSSQSKPAITCLNHREKRTYMYEWSYI